MLQEMVQEADEPVLTKLTDITVTFSESPMVSLTFVISQYQSKGAKMGYLFKKSHLVISDRELKNFFFRQIKTVTDRILHFGGIFPNLYNIFKG